MAQESLNLGSLLAVLRRRLWLFLAVLVLVIPTALAVAYTLPPVYRSSGTILIEQQVIPEDLVRTTVTSFASERIQLIRQRAMTTGNLLGIIERNRLYAEDRRSKSREVIVERMRNDIDVSMISSNVRDRSGAATQATIAFTVFYENESPELAQRVASELVTLFLNENLKTRTALASETSAFLADETKRLADAVAELERQVAQFKEQNAGLLPGNADINVRLLEVTRQEHGALARELANQEDRRVLLEAQLEQAERLRQIATGSTVLTPEERLRQLEDAYVLASSQHTQSHPDVISLRRQLDAVRSTLPTSDGQSARNLELESARAELAYLESVTGPRRPETTRARERLAQLEAQATGSSLSPRPTTPAALQVRLQIEALGMEARRIHERRAELEAKIKEYEDRVTRGPQVELEYLSMVRDLDNTVAKYREIKAKEMQAQMAQSLEAERKGERFTLIEPPLLPEEPVKPNRQGIAFIGSVLGLGGAVGAVALTEAADGTIRGSRAVATVSGMLPLAGIPYILGSADRRRRRRVLVGAGAAVGAVAVIAVGATHFLYLPLDVLWFVMLRKLGV